MRKQTEMMFLDLPIWDYRMRATLTQMTTLLNGMCRSVAKNKEFLDWMNAQKFDLAFAYMADACPVGIIHYAKIPTWIWLSSAGLVDFAAYYMGVPMVPSYSPPITMESTDEMNFFERTKSLLGQILLVTIWKRTFADQETAIFREIDPNFPHIVELAQKCPLVMVNSNELYEFPRPTLAKIVNVGGVGIQLKDAKPLNPEFQRIVDKCEGLVVFSFGSVAPSHLMPDSWKTAFLEAFARFPSLNFVLRYEGEDLKGVINTGVPMITVALWGDQPRNAKMAAKLGIAVNLQKNDISTTTVTEALNKVINGKRKGTQYFPDFSYSQNVKRLSLMVKKKPVSPNHLVVAWAEFVAEFKTLDNLVPAGTKLNFIQYHSLDVIGFLLAVTILVLFVFWKILRFLFSELYNLSLKIRKQKQTMVAPSMQEWATSQISITLQRPTVPRHVVYARSGDCSTELIKYKRFSKPNVSLFGFESHSSESPKGR
ncbi:unnamed protein product [Haemonchus placei]|uniref:glucuronosyltransferase n=1 Tax=Haemonchus placei TaxID=6290 RepID=A0A3P7YFV7_HAEPC|nr:unnamed protein product [Haemonchus placei]